MKQNRHVIRLIRRHGCAPLLPYAFAYRVCARLFPGNAAKLDFFMHRSLGWGLVLVALFCQSVPAGEIGFLEDFALAKDRAAALKQLIPGSEDYYYYHCLHYQNTEQFNKVDAMLPAWIQRHGQTARVKEIRHRQALLTYDKSPDKSLAYLVETLGLQFNHERQLPGAKADLPTRLNPEAITRET